MEDDEGAWKEANHRRRSYGAQSLVHCYNRACRSVITIVMSGVVILHFSLLPSQQASYCSTDPSSRRALRAFQAAAGDLELGALSVSATPFHLSICCLVFLSVCLISLSISISISSSLLQTGCSFWIFMKQGHSVVQILSFRVWCPLLPKERREVCIRARSRSRKGRGRICVLVVMSVFFPCLDPRFSCIASETECRGFLKVLEQYRIIL